MAAVEENMGWFVFYWDELLPHVGPQKTNFWDPSVRYSQTITNAESYKDSPITTQMEAFAVLCLENSWTYWENWYKLQDKFPYKKLLKCPKNLVPGQDSAHYNDGYFLQRKTNTVYFFGPKFDSMYTKSNAGSNIAGGWTEEGKRRFEVLCKSIRSARMSPQNKQIEEMVLRKVCELKVNGTASSGGEATQQPTADDYSRGNSHLLGAFDPDYAESLGYNLAHEEEEEKEQDDGKLPARRQELAGSDDESTGNYEENGEYDEEDYPQVGV